MNNPSAFPRPASEAHLHGMYSAQEGMTLRDYFAAKALSTILGQYDFTFFEEDEDEKEEDKFSFIVAKNAYAMADSMLKARE